ncbi:MAG: ribosomal protein L11 methyltransferase [Firmicutes bacterium ZCTH02-B6]|nr:MAG: ribosomal protein L11 methyltransferase [Firmicutes bacterium ZCTH02-B6]
MRWMKVAVQTGAECEEAVTQILLSAGAQGVVLEGDGSRRAVVAYLPEHTQVSVDDLEQRVRDLERYGLEPGPARVSVEWVQDEDWAESWKRHYQPLAIGRRLLVKPAWVRAPYDGRIVIELDPGMAFGTGYHPTTALCLEALEELVQEGDTIVDVGTGSGILAIAAARLGAGSIVAVDIDPQAVQVARENCRRNGVHERVWVATGSTAAASALLAGKQARLVVANILADVISDMAEELYGLLQPGGLLVASGIIDDACPQVQESLVRASFAVREERARAEWRCLIAERTS